MGASHERLPVLIYQWEGESVTEVRLEGERVWLDGGVAGGVRNYRGIIGCRRDGCEMSRAC